MYGTHSQENAIYLTSSAINGAIMCINRFALRFLLGGSTFVRHPLTRKRNSSHILGNKQSDNADKSL
ncbi:MAG TPA: hypothetical protein DHW16_04855 [Ruminococcaceae bacterium]|nr:hypothetical protein [Oscillospiraceae bacterium]